MDADGVSGSKRRRGGSPGPGASKGGSVSAEGCSIGAAYSLDEYVWTRARERLGVDITRASGARRSPLARTASRSAAQPTRSCGVLVLLSRRRICTKTTYSSADRYHVSQCD